MPWPLVALLLVLGAVLGLLGLALVVEWPWKREPERNIEVSPLLMNPATNKHAVMHKMRAVAEEHRSKNKDVIIFPEGRDEEGT
ncbi:hypothetical protein [Amycolatopsis lurida]|uniref:hypothetical protein n=1 Tax=Amycolatopsis lurida TaxID=31959 RepID=UPI00364D13FD